MFCVIEHNKEERWAHSRELFFRDGPIFLEMGPSMTSHGLISLFSFLRLFNVVDLRGTLPGRLWLVSFVVRGGSFAYRWSDPGWIACQSRGADRRADWFSLRAAAVERGHCFVNTFNTPAEPSCLLRWSCFVSPFSRGWDRAGVSPAIAPTKPRTPSRLLASNPGSRPFQSVSSGEETLTLGPLRA